VTDRFRLLVPPARRFRILHQETVFDDCLN